jgi:transcriptional regulator with XRE-family HTH domain
MESKPLDTSEPRGISRESRAFFKRLGKRIARLRGEMSQAELAQILELSEETLAAIERGEQRPPLASMPKLAMRFGVAIIDMVDSTQLAMPPKMQRHIETLKRLSRADQRFVMRVVETLAQSSRPSEGSSHGN